MKESVPGALEVGRARHAFLHGSFISFVVSTKRTGAKRAGLTRFD
jgi:hypothetical protein